MRSVCLFKVFFFFLYSHVSKLNKIDNKWTIALNFLHITAEPNVCPYSPVPLGDGVGRVGTTCAVLGTRRPTNPLVSLRVLVHLEFSRPLLSLRSLPLFFSAYERLLAALFNTH
ncbi:hypothetical protein SKAU_G00403790 [Synaphobranchus kaupii]|uniref:Secreted protein n=1 Tax=Synaphobranchus kaupii TaxID=118154 RepID=A0A9Q1IBT6_SYNKA|nr:hypothetical protein SKAU_G00403790 [Synaphobranchus kaupii]